MKDIQLTVTVDEVNQLLDALGQQPFIRVYQLIGKIQQQAQAQLHDEFPPDLKLQDKP